MSEIAKQIGTDEIIFSGHLYEIVHRKMQSGGETKIFEFARRTPGVRLIIINSQDKTILLTKEFRYELNDYDIRLPGGKVCDTLEEYHQNIDINSAAQTAAIKEAEEEVGIIPKEITLFTVAGSGGPHLVWDLYYYVVNQFETTSPKTGFGENISSIWTPYQDALQLCINKMREYRSLGVLIKFMESIKS